MDAALHEILDRALFAGGSQLRRGELVSADAEGNRLLAELLTANYLARAPQNRYSVTEEGRLAWEAEAPEERRRQWREYKANELQRTLAECLQVVEQQAQREKALTAAQRRKYAAPLALALERKLIAPDEKEHRYHLRPAGKELLLAQLPPRVQLQELQRLHQELYDRWRAAQQSLQDQFDRYQEQAGASRRTAEQLSARVEQARAEYAESLRQLQLQAEVLEAAQHLEESIVRAGQNALQAVQQASAHGEQLADQVRRQLLQQQVEQEDFRHVFQNRLAVVRGEITPGDSKSAVDITSSLNPEVPETAVWAATLQAYERLRREREPVKLPELTDAVLLAVYGLTDEALDQFLLHWEQQGKLQLLPLADTAEDRAAEGIPSSRGLLFFVQLTPAAAADPAAAGG